MTRTLSNYQSNFFDKSESGHSLPLPGLARPGGIHIFTAGFFDQVKLQDEHVMSVTNTNEKSTNTLLHHPISRAC